MLMKDAFDYITGVGFRGVVINNDTQNAGFFYVEDQYSFNIITIGYLGSFLFLFFILSPLRRWTLFYKHKDSFVLYFGVIGILFSLLSSKTTIIFISQQVSLVFSLFYSIILQPRSLSKLSCDVR